MADAAIGEQTRGIATKKKPAPNPKKTMKGKPREDFGQAAVRIVKEATERNQFWLASTSP
jgi:hypothetical protein